jgi:NADH-quinone oxidoreductase subunit N
MDYISIFQMKQELSMVVVFVAILLADLFLPERRRNMLMALSCSLLTLQLIVSAIPADVTLFGGMYRSTPIASLMKSVLTVGTILLLLQSERWIRRGDTRHKAGEFYLLIVSTLIGMFFMISAGHFLLFFLGLELATVPMACLVAFDKYKGHSAEAGAKFILSALFSSGIFLYGVSMVYGTVGTLYFEDIPAGLTGTPLQILALVFVFAGMGFKLSLVPFHLWTADTYQGAPTAVSGYLSVISKGAAAFALMSMLIHVFEPMRREWSLLISVVIVVTITIANLFAMRQSNLKRFMAFSSVSQAGYIMLAVVAGNAQGMTSLIYYIVVYIVANLAVFGCIAAIEQQTHGCVEREDYNGLYASNPRLSMVMTLALFSLAGIPPFAGFFSKFFVFAAAFNGGFTLIVFIALVNTIISLYYYLLIVKAIFITPNEHPIEPFKTPATMRLSLIICIVGIVLLGLSSGVYQLISDTAALTM